MDGAEKKTLATVEASLSEAWEKVRTILSGSEPKDFGAVEEYLRTEGQEIGRTLLQNALDAQSINERPRPQEQCAAGHRYEALEQRTKRVTTLVGNVTIRRWYYYDGACGKGKIPLDSAWDIEHTSFSPEMRRLMAQMGALLPFRSAAEQLRSLSGISVDSKDIERIIRPVASRVEATEREPMSVPPGGVLYVSMDGTGVPMVQQELTGRKGKGSDGQAKTREAKLGCFFTQTKRDSQGYPVRDDNSTTYVGAIASPDAFGQQLWREAKRRGIDTAQTVVALCDAAAWEWNLVEEYFPNAVQIVDLYHAREHYWTIARAKWPNNPRRQHQWAKKREKELDSGQAQRVARAISRLRPCTPELQALCLREAEFFVKNERRMAYKRFRRRGFFVGTGVLEAGCKTVIGQRLKQPGMHWTVNGANAIISLRSALVGHDWPVAENYAKAA